MLIKSLDALTALQKGMKALAGSCVAMVTATKVTENIPALTRAVDIFNDLDLKTNQAIAVSSKTPSLSSIPTHTLN